MGEFLKKKIFEKPKIPQEIEIKEKPEKEKEKDRGEYWRDHQWRERIFFLKLFEEEKPMSFKELLEKSGISEESGTKRFRKIGDIREIINKSKENGLVVEIKKNVFQINPKSPSFETFKRFLEREKKKEKYEDS